MINSLLNFLHMGGYGFYVWTSYMSVLAFLSLQWFFPWRRWRRYLRHQNSHHE